MFNQQEQDNMFGNSSVFVNADGVSFSTLDTPIKKETSKTNETKKKDATTFALHSYDTLVKASSNYEINAYLDKCFNNNYSDGDNLLNGVDLINFAASTAAA